MALQNAATVLLAIFFFFFFSYSIASPSPSTQGPSAAGPSKQPVATHPSPCARELAPAPSLASSPLSSPDCTTVVIDNLSPCLTFVEKGSNASVPDTGCCRGLAAVVSTQPMCLCQLLGGGSNAIPVEIDRARALTLPTVCRVQTPPVSLCAVTGAPIISPALAPLIAPSLASSPSIDQDQGSSGPTIITASPAAAQPRPPSNSATPSNSKSSMLAAAATTTIILSMLPGAITAL